MHAFHLMPADSDVAIVAFSNLRLPADDGFHFQTLMESFPDVSRLLVRDPSELWYNAGLPGIGETVEEIAAWLRTKLAELGAERVVTVGTSMGGYAAILFGCMVGARRALALAPQSLLDVRLPALVPPPEVNRQVIDLEPVMRDFPQTEVDVVFGRDSILDVFHAQRIGVLDSVRLLSPQRSGHLIARQLKREGRLRELVDEALESGATGDWPAAPAIEPELLERLREGLFAWRRDWTEVEKAIAPVAARYPDWPAPHAALAKATLRMADRDGVRRSLATAAQAGPCGHRLGRRIERAKTLVDEGRFDEADDALGFLMLC